MSDTIPEFDFESAIVEESGTEMPDVPRDALACVTCGKSLTYGGRGPKPKYCADHKKNKSSGTKRAAKKTGTDYRAGIEGLMQPLSLGLTMLGAQQKNAAFLADAYVLSVQTPTIAEAISDIANDQPQIAAVLDKVLKVGPYGALIGALMPLAVQMLANHKIIPATIPGVHSAEEILMMAEAAANAG